MKLARRIAIFITISYCSPFFVIGFIYQVAVDWFNFGRNTADKALDES